MIESVYGQNMEHSVELLKKISAKFFICQVRV